MASSQHSTSLSTSQQAELQQSPDTLPHIQSEQVEHKVHSPQLPEQLAQHLPQQLQQQPLPLLLDLPAAPEVHKHLQLASTSAQSLQTWQEHSNNPLIYGVRLIGDAQLPDQFTGISAHDLICHGQWGAEQLQKAHNSDSGMQLILPVATKPAVVHKLVQALYSGYLELPNHVEELMILASSIQVQYSSSVKSGDILPVVVGSCTYY